MSRGTVSHVSLLHHAIGCDWQVYTYFNVQPSRRLLSPQEPAWLLLSSMCCQRDEESLAGV